MLLLLLINLKSNAQMTLNFRANTDSIFTGRDVCFINSSQNVPANVSFKWIIVKYQHISSFLWSQGIFTTSTVNDSIKTKFNADVVTSIKLYAIFNNQIIDSVIKSFSIYYKATESEVCRCHNLCIDNVINGSFERLNGGFPIDPSDCGDYGLWTLADGWGRAGTHTSNGFTSPDLFLTCVSPSAVNHIPNTVFGYQQPNAIGDSVFGGLITYQHAVGDNLASPYREYFGKQLCTDTITPTNDPKTLIPGRKYVVGIKYALATNSSYSTDNLGIFIGHSNNNNGVDSVYTQGSNADNKFEIASTPNPYDWDTLHPQIKLNQPVPTNLIGQWLILKDTITPTSTYDYIIIGGFKSNNTISLVPTGVPPLSDGTNWASLCYFFIDSLFIQPVHFSKKQKDTLCLGQSIKLTSPLDSSIMASYNWNNGSHNQSITVSPKTDSTYICTVTDHYYNCVYSDTFNVVVRKPVHLTISGFNNDCHSQAVYHIDSISANQTYYWRPYPYFGGHTHTDSFTVNWNIDWNNIPDGYLYLKVYTDDIKYCKLPDSIKIFKCCKADYPALWKDTVVNSASGIIPSTILNGTAVFNTNYVINCSQIFMGPEAKIIVNPPYRLTIINTNISAGCNYMWDGIYIQDSNAMLVDSSNISNPRSQNDAYNLIVSENGGKFRLRNIIFYNNLTSVLVKNYFHYGIGAFGPHKGIITGCKFDKLNNGMINPHLYEKPKHGVYLDNVFKITIGDSANASYINNFQNIFCGIASFNSIANVYNCNFKNIKVVGASCFTQPGDFTTLFCETAIHSVATINDPTHFNPSQLACGGTIATSRDSIYNCSTGIYTYKTLTKINNIKVRATNVGVFCQDASNACYVVNSTFKNSTLIGIKFINTVSTIRKLNIKNDSILDPTYGIYLSNVASHATQMSLKTVVSNNYITLVKNSVTSGIRLEMCNYVEAYCNKVTRTTIPSTSYRTYIKGFQIEQTANGLIRDNTTERIGIGVKCAGSLLGTQFKCNTSDGSYSGFYCDANYGGVQTVLSYQGAVNTPWDNKWYNIPGTGWAIDAAAGYSQPTLAYWYYRSVGAQFNPTISSNALNGITKSSAGNTAPTACTTCSGSLMMTGLTTPVQIVSTGNQQNELTAIIDETNNYNELDEQFKYFEKQYAFSLLNSNPSLINAQSGEFYNELNNGNIGSFDKVYKFAQNSDFENAKVLNEQIAPVNNIETNRKWVNDVYLKYVIPQVLIPQNIVSDLVTLASSSPFVEGDAVYTARAIVRYTEPNPVNKNMEQSNEDEQNAQVNPNNELKVLVYPNPANDYFTVEIIGNSNKSVKFVLTNTLGVNVYEGLFNSSLNKIDSKQFKQGIYLYKAIIDNNDGNAVNGRIVISR